MYAMVRVRATAKQVRGAESERRESEPGKQLGWFLLGNVSAMALIGPVYALQRWPEFVLVCSENSPGKKLLRFAAENCQSKFAVFRGKKLLVKSRCVLGQKVRTVGLLAFGQ